MERSEGVSTRSGTGTAVDRKDSMKKNGMAKDKMTK
jgi:hypothetical protein